MIIITTRFYDTIGAIRRRHNPVMSSLFMKSTTKHYHIINRYNNLQSSITTIMKSKWTLEDFKNAIQGNKNGILKHLTLIPPPSKIVADTQQIFLQESGLKDSANVDAQLTWLLDNEYEIYQLYQSQVYTDFLSEMSCWVEINPGVHPCLDHLVKQLNTEIFRESMLSVMPNEVAMAIVALEGSISQGRRSRAGGSLMEQLEFVLNLHGFEIDIHFRREQKVEGKQPTKLDYVFPSVEFMVQNANQAVTCANMTTINDRYRLALQQLQPNTNRKVLTALGAYAYKTQVSKLSTNILQEFNNNQIKVVVLENAIKLLDDTTGTAQTYTQWFEELKILSTFW